MPATRDDELPIEVRSSTVHGSGAFATVDLPPGTPIGRYAGRRLSPRAVAARDWDHALTYVFGLSDGSVIDGSEGGNATRHINHSCTPNCVAYEIMPTRGRPWIEVEALTHIAAGSELFLDYGLDVGGHAPADYPCRCGTRACRGSMVAPAEGA